MYSIFIFLFWYPILSRQLCFIFTQDVEKPRMLKGDIQCIFNHCVRLWLQSPFWRLTHGGWVCLHIVSVQITVATYFQCNNINACDSQIQTRDPRTLCHLYRGMGLQWGYLGFSCDQNNHDSSSAYVLQSECKDKHLWNAAWCTKIIDAFCLCLFPRVVRKNPNTPNWSSMADEYRSSGISYLYLWCDSKFTETFIYYSIISSQKEKS